MAGVDIGAEIEKALRDLTDDELQIEHLHASSLREGLSKRPAHLQAILRVAIERERRRRRAEIRQLNEDFHGPVEAWWGSPDDLPPDP